MELFLILSFSITGCISISTFTSLLGISIGITSSAIGLKICAVIAGIKIFNSIFKKKEKKQDKTALLGKAKLTGIEVLISKALIDSNISYDDFFIINNVLKEYDDMKKEIKNYLISLLNISAYL